MAETPEKILAAARWFILDKVPYFRSGIRALSFVITEEAMYDSPQIQPDGSVKLVPVPSVCTTKSGIVLCHPLAVQERGMVEMATTILHEFFHILKEHHKRCDRGHCNHAIFNLAGDCEINHQIKGAGFAFSKRIGRILPETFKLPDGRTAEFYYDELIKKASEGGTGDDPGCGSCAGNKQDFEKEFDKEEYGAKTEPELERTRNQVAADMQSAEGAKAGSVPSELLVWANARLKPPQVRWQDKLGRAVRSAMANKAGSVEYTLQRPSRRQGAYAGMSHMPVMAGMRKPLPDVVVAFDTSGSMGTPEGELALSELNGLLKTVEGTVTMLSCDADVHGPATKITSVTHAKKLMVGGGGTSFIPIFDYVNKLRVKPSCLILATDGGGPAPKNPPVGYPVIWLLTGKNYRAPCDWGIRINVSSEV